PAPASSLGEGADFHRSAGASRLRAAEADQSLLLGIIWLAPFLSNKLVRMTRTAALLLAVLTSLSLASVARAETAGFGPPPAAKLSVERLAPIADFINGEI